MILLKILNIIFFMPVAKYASRATGVLYNPAVDNWCPTNAQAEALGSLWPYIVMTHRGTDSSCSTRCA